MSTRLTRGILAFRRQQNLIKSKKHSRSGSKSGGLSSPKKDFGDGKSTSINVIVNKNADQTPTKKNRRQSFKVGLINKIESNNASLEQPNRYSNYTSKVTLQVYNSKAVTPDKCTRDSMDLELQQMAKRENQIREKFNDHDA